MLEPIKETLGDYCKRFELAKDERGAVGSPIIARLDGRAFHTFTEGLERPYDVRLSSLMISTTEYLVRHTQAILGYTQSDEITLIWYQPADTQGSYFFDGRFMKIATVCAGMASGLFNKHLPQAIPEKASKLPIFDGRAWSVPTLRDAYLSVLWREQDAIKNSITMAALAHFPHKQLQNVNGEQKKQMLQEIGKPWDVMPEFFRKGTYVKRVEVERMLTSEELSRIPEQHRPTGPVLRGEVQSVSLPELSSVSNAQEILFGDLK